MGNNKKWVRLKKVMQKMMQIKFKPSKGDGAIISDSLATVIGGGKVETNPPFIVKDSTVVAKPRQ